ncbi:MAG: hypothetical protein KDB01_12750 [Planctomycetaceae bacterium]|nr:hypothetical protein [Planctomycetaceae bacterium]
MNGIEIVTGSRLHFGLICSRPAARWRFGGIGVMLRQPAWRLRVTPINGDTDLIEATSIARLRVREFLHRIRSHQQVPSLRLQVFEETSFHSGLGSGTQLSLALSAAAELLTRRRLEEDPFQLARMADRAERSAIGTVGFFKGGFLIDHGAVADGTLIRQVDCLTFPADWRFVLVHPADAQGLSGEREQTFFRQQASMPATLVDSLEQQILQHIAPSIRERRFDVFANSLENYGRMVGTFYSAEQGGVFAHPSITQLVEQLQTHGVIGMAQSSWGPLIGVPARSQQHADEIAKLIPSCLDEQALQVSISEPFNTGAIIRSMVNDAADRRFV